MLLQSYCFLLLVSLFTNNRLVTASPSPLENKIPGPSLTSKRDSSSCSEPLVPEESTTKWWRAEIEHNGSTPHSGDPNYKYYRTVLEYGADSTGKKDSSDAFNDAVSLPKRRGHITTQPAYIYVPPGTYLIKKPISLLVGTFLIGDAITLPTLVAHPDLASTGSVSGPGPVVIYAHDNHFKTNPASQNFYITVRNLIIDTTNVEPGIEIAGLDWSVSQGCSLGNIHFVMPSGTGTGGENRHTGITMSQFGSGIEVGDCTFKGGGTGISVQSQQYLLKNLTFDGCRVGISIVWSFVTVIQGCTFKNCEFGIDTTQGHANQSGGTISVVDSSAENCSGAGIRIKDDKGSNSSLVLDYFTLEENTPAAVVALNGNVMLKESVPAGQTWVMGKINPGGYQSGAFIPINRPKGLLSGDEYFTMSLPQYENYSKDQVVSITSDPEHQVYGDGLHDDGPAINAILQQYAGCKIIFFPQGIYLTKTTIHISPASRIVGEAFSVITGAGPLFSDAENPQPVVRVGNPGDKGVAQITDMFISVAEVSPGAILVEVNMAADNPGDVGFWNCIFRVGGTVDTAINCPHPDPVGCKAAFALLHVTETGSGYFDNVWGWVADHHLDDMRLTQNIAVGRGLLVESTSPTWFVGSSFEHCVLYQYALHDASNVYMALQQTESPYWQGEGTPHRAPSPWQPVTDMGDPTFDNCDAQGESDSDLCYRSWAVHISGKSTQKIVIHGSALWAFFNSMSDNSYEGATCDETAGVCQLNAIYIEDAGGMYWYSAATKATENIFYDLTGGGENITVQKEYTGSWGGAVAAYLGDIGLPAADDNESGVGAGSDGKNNEAVRNSIWGFYTVLGYLSGILMLL